MPFFFQFVQIEAMGIGVWPKNNAKSLVIDKRNFFLAS
jgi:hypothetical protein